MDDLIENLAVILLSALGGALVVGAWLVNRVRSDKPILLLGNRKGKKVGRHAHDREAVQKALEVAAQPVPVRVDRSVLEPIEEWKVKEFAYQVMTRYPGRSLSETLDYMEACLEVAGFVIVRGTEAKPDGTVQ